MTRTRTRRFGLAALVPLRTGVFFTTDPGDFVHLLLAAALIVAFNTVLEAGRRGSREAIGSNCPMVSTEVAIRTAVVVGVLHVHPNC